MVVKSKIGRKRYIVFKIDAESIISKRDLIYTLNNYTSNKNSNTQVGLITPPPVAPKKSNKITRKLHSERFLKQPWIIYLKNNYGLIQCHHLDKEKMIQFLQSISCAGKAKNRVKIQTLGTTGTIHSARKKYLDKLNVYPPQIFNSK
jgi:RNase P/RNase MRP subunit POP5